MVKMIILVDDDAVVNLCNQNLIQRNYPNIPIEIFENSTSAFEFVNNLKSQTSSGNDIIFFLDYQIPDMDGFELMEEIENRELDLDCNISVYLLTGKNSVLIQEKIKVFPMVKGFFEKPLTLGNLAGIF